MTEALVTPIKDFITLNSGGRVDPEEIEAVYTKVAPVKEMCVFTVFGMHGVGRSRVLWAVIRPDLDDFREYNEVNLRGVLQERFDNAAALLPYYKRLKGFTIVLESLPRTIFGKLRRDAVKRLYEPRVIAGIEGALPVSGKSSPEDIELMGSAVGVKVIECLKEQSGIRREIILEDSLELDLGIDSLGRIQLVSGLEVAFEAAVKAEAVSRAFSVKDLVSGITEALKEAGDVPREEQGIVLGPDYWKDTLHVLPNKESLEMLELEPGFFAWLFRFCLTAVDCLIFKVFFNIKSEGSENVPEKGAYILYGNHTSFLDGPCIAACLPRRAEFQIFYFVFGPYFFRPFVRSRLLRNLVKMGRFIPFDFSTHFLEALRSSYYVLHHGKGLCFFPEGLRSSNGKIGEFKKGFGVLAKESMSRLVPVVIQGAYEAWPSTAKYCKRHPISVKFGKPLLPEDLEKEGRTMGAKDSYESICVAARKALMRLKEGPL